LGSKLSIVTTAFVRYEGILREVDPINKAMTLINIRSFGTEGRRGGENEIAPSTTDI
jgi:protein LSM14